MMSRPLLSAPRKKWSLQVGPIGLPSRSTTSVSLPSIMTLSERWFSSGVVSAIWLAQSGAARQAATTSTKTTPAASATLSRRSRRQVRRQGPSPGRSAGSPASSSEESSVNSVPAAPASSRSAATGP